MKEIKLQKLRLLNFKGFSSIEINFADLTVISGANATGKTTLMDAFTWVLFGKDSDDRKDFNIKTLDPEGKIIEKIDHEVEATLFVDGGTTILRRCYREKWQTRRGSEESEMTGHETLFFWNDVPLQAGEYQQKIDQILTESTFKLITNPLHFNSQMKWQNRRNILVSMAGEVETPAEFIDLIESMGTKSLDEYRKELAAKKKKLNDELKTIPARIDEVHRSTPEPQDWDAIDKEIFNLELKKEEAEAEITDASKSVDAVLKANRDRINRISELKQKVSDIELAGHRALNEAMYARDAKIKNIRSEHASIKGSMEARDANVLFYKEKITGLENDLAELRSTWINKNAEKLVFPDGTFVCPTCKRELEPEDIEAKKAEMLVSFNKNKDAELKSISEQGKLLNGRIDQYKAEIARLESEDFSQKLTVLEDMLSEAQSEKLEKVPYPKEYNLYLSEISSLEAEQAETVTSDKYTVQLKLRRTGYQDRIDILRKQLQSKGQIESANIRKEELLRQEKSFSQQLADLEKIEFNIQNYIRAKVNLLEERINGMFTTVKFRLFDQQINGGLVECCDTLVSGVPWQDANNAAKINSGIDIINVLSNHLQVSAPVWVDNAESVNLIQPTVAQRIELYVTNDNNLTVENY